MIILDLNFKEWAVAGGWDGWLQLHGIRFMGWYRLEGLGV